MLLDPGAGIVVQGITGREARAMVGDMLAYGSNIVAGVTPGKGGEKVQGIPVYDTVGQVLEEHDPAISVISVPAPAVLEAALEAFAHGIELCVIMSERVPRLDASRIVSAADARCTVIGPNSLGLIRPGLAKVGTIGGRVDNVRRSYMEGEVAVLSRSGGMTTEIASFLTSNRIGQSIAVGVGGDPIIGSDFVQLIELLEADPATSAVVIYGEPGGVAEEELARHLERNGAGCASTPSSPGASWTGSKACVSGTPAPSWRRAADPCAERKRRCAARGFSWRRVRRSFDGTSQMSDFWRTSISRVKPNEILVRGYPIEQLTRRCSFGDTVYLLLKGELPSGAEGRMVEAILVSCCEHSLASPSVDAVRFVASCGVPLQTAVAAGSAPSAMSTEGRWNPAHAFCRKPWPRTAPPPRWVAAQRAAGRRLPGFGHPAHNPDPRAVTLFELADEWRIAGAHVAFARCLEDALEEDLGRRLPLNVDGAIAALICDMGIDPALGKTFFIVSRAPGYAAHAHEQATRERPFKAAGVDSISYSGPERRDVE